MSDRPRYVYPHPNWRPLSTRARPLTEGEVPHTFDQFVYTIEQLKTELETIRCINETVKDHTYGGVRDPLSFVKATHIFDYNNGVRAAVEVRDIYQGHTIHLRIEGNYGYKMIVNDPWDKKLFRDEIIPMYIKDALKGIEKLKQENSDEEILNLLLGGNDETHNSSNKQ